MFSLTNFDIMVSGISIPQMISNFIKHPVLIQRKFSISLSYIEGGPGVNANTYIRTHTQICACVRIYIYILGCSINATYAYKWNN